APKSESFVMLMTVAIILYTQNLAIGVVIGVIISALIFVGNISRVTVEQEGQLFKVKGPLFFASTTRFTQFFQGIEATDITIDFSNSQLWDESAVGAIVKVTQQLESKGMVVQIVGLNDSSTQLFERLT